MRKRADRGAERLLHQTTQPRSEVGGDDVWECLELEIYMLT